MAVTLPPMHLETNPRSRGRARRSGVTPRRSLPPCVGCGERFRDRWRDPDGLCGDCVMDLRIDTYERAMRGEFVYGLGALAGLRTPPARQHRGGRR